MTSTPNSIPKHRPVASLVELLVAVAVTSALLLVFAWPRTDSAASPHKTTSLAEALPFVAAGSGWSIRGLPTSADSVVGVLTWAPKPRLDLVSASTGEPLLSLEVGYNPMAVLRRGANQLLVSDAVEVQTPGGRVELRSRLLTFDLAGPGLVSEVELPGRIRYTAFANGLTLSDSERWLRYVALHQPADPAECGADPATCDRYGLAQLDLATAGSAVVEAPLPLGCGWPSVAGVRDGALVTCRNGDSFQVDAGSSTAASKPMGRELPFERNPVLRKNRSEIMWQGDGFGSLGTDGTFYPETGSPPVQALPTVGTPMAGQVVALDASRVAITWRASGHGAADGVSIFNAKTGKVEQNVPARGVIAIAQSGGKLIALGEDGRLTVIFGPGAPRRLGSVSPFDGEFVTIR